MTISESLANWLKEFLEIVTIETNEIEGKSDRCGLYRNFERDVEQHISNTYNITEYYQFFAKQPLQDEESNDEWLEKIMYLVDDKNYCEEYPVLGNNRSCLEIELTGQPYKFEEETNKTIYKIKIKIKYLRKRDVEQW